MPVGLNKKKVAMSPGVSSDGNSTSGTFAMARADNRVKPKCFFIEASE